MDNPELIRKIRSFNRKKNSFLKRFLNKERLPHGRFFINHDKKLIYIENPKAASRSILRLFECIHPNSNKSVECHIEEKNLKIMFPSMLNVAYPRYMAINKRGIVREMRDRVTKRERDTYSFFTFVRSPFKRSVSGFCDKILNGTLKFSDKKQSHENFFGKRMSDNPDDFKLFLKKYVKKIDNEDINVHFKRQIDLLNPDGKVSLNFIGKLENFKDDWEKLTKEFDLPKKEIIHINKSKRKSDYRDYYKDIESVEIVYEKYKEDIEQFGYEQEYEDLKRYVLDKTTK